jgi:hypothetical protein
MNFILTLFDSVFQGLHDDTKINRIGLQEKTPYTTGSSIFIINLGSKKAKSGFLPQFLPKSGIEPENNSPTTTNYFFALFSNSRGTIPSFFQEGIEVNTGTITRALKAKGHNLPRTLPISTILVSINSTDS